MVQRSCWVTAAAIVGAPEVAQLRQSESQESSLQLCLFLIVFAIDLLILSSDYRRVRALRGLRERNSNNDTFIPISLRKPERKRG